MYKRQSFILASTEWVYGNLCADLINEDNKPNLLELNSAYAKSKLICEQILQSRSDEGIKNIIFRFGIIYGRRRFGHTAFESLIKNCMESSIVNIGCLKTSRRFINVDILSRVIIENFRDINGGVYNLTSSSLITLENIIHECELLLDKKIIINELSPEGASIRNVYSKYETFKNLDSRDLSEKIKELIDYFKND